MKKRMFLLPILCFCSLVSCDKSDQINVQDSQVESEVKVNKVVERAIAELGKPYAWGAIGPDSYDASGFVSYCVTGQHIRLGTCTTFMNYLEAETPAPGDICVNVNNCGIYMGNNQMIFAAGFGDVVRYGNIEQTMKIVKYPGNN